MKTKTPRSWKIAEAIWPRRHYWLRAENFKALQKYVHKNFDHSPKTGVYDVGVRMAIRHVERRMKLLGEKK